jgi:hypothetical protein
VNQAQESAVRALRTAQAQLRVAESIGNKFSAQVARAKIAQAEADYQAASK